MFKRRSLPSSRLYDQNTFYRAFMQDMSCAKKQLIIESPFITRKRVDMLLPTLEKLRRRGVQIIINTRSPEDHDGIYQVQAAEVISAFQALGIVVLYTAGHHRKLAIIDSEIIWEGSLNILSFSDSCEIMRRITSSDEASALIDFIKLNKFTGAMR
ncbi:MAG TPA: phospholipase D-like domain-containing protein [Candidatus Saccharimonadales bacterium]|nr:phospholipase D-like domain-containing protein [Candidatus Saccharimonadales bacterium]